ncbi:MAG TPA: GNAT family N-acetyltransferase [Thermoanaerobaculia bacterium]|nr:GNAT family N-acetyltransferase [Thermoanaerobaculia bacterium]
MKGQRLFVRPMQPADQEPVQALLGYVPERGYIGKLVGELVAVLAVTPAGGDALRVENLFVTSDLRRKRIGRFMLEEAARQSGGALVVEEPGEAREFFERAGFEQVGVRWIRRVG